MRRISVLRCFGLPRVALRSAAAVLLCAGGLYSQNVAVKAGTLHTMAGEPLKNAVVVITNGKIAAVGAEGKVTVPKGYKTLSAAVVTPGLVDARATVGLTGYLNASTDQDQLEKSAAIQPELRAIDSYDPKERLIEWVRSFGVTTMNTGHAPGAVISGQLMVVKTRGNSVEEAMVKPLSMVAASLGEEGRAKEPGKSPGTSAKEVAILRAELIKAQEYMKKQSGSKGPDRDLSLEVLSSVLKGDVPLLITANRSRDIMSAIRLAKEFHFKLILDGAAEADLVMDQIKESGYPVFIHPTMQRQSEETENGSFETAAHLQAAGIPWALQSGFESYVPKVRVTLFEAGVAAANGLTFEQALASVTMSAAKLIGVADRVGSVEAGKDGDLALFDGDPFEYTTHCVGTVIDGKQEFAGKQ